MSRKHFFVSTIVLLNFLFSTSLFAQWGKPYSNSWLNNLHTQKFVKINIDKDGLYRIPVASLPSSFSKDDPMKFQLWHRGKEVAIISATANEIVFYGIKNDGKSDELLYRNTSFEPDPKARTNPYLSIYSDESSYFLTTSQDNSSAHRANTVFKPLDTNQSAVKYHMQADVVTFTDQDSYSQENNFFTLTMIQSFLEKGKGMTSKIYGKNASLTHPLLFGDPVFSFQFENLVKDLSQKPQVELLIYGRTNTNNDVSVQVGKTASLLRTIPGNLTLQGFTDAKKQFELDVSENSDISPEGSFTFKLFSNKISSDWNSVGMYSVTYYKVVYPQSFDMAGKQNKVFRLVPTNENTSRVSISNPAPNSRIYDVTNTANPVLLTGTSVNGKLEVMVPRIVNQALSLLVTAETNVVSSEKVELVSMPFIEPLNYDYLILTTEKLEQAAIEYSNYRKSIEGKSYKPLVIKIKDVYNQFNYGEPSPVAIQRFVDYMLSKGVTSRHNLLLIGNSISYGDSTIKNKELKNQVPTFGYPGSDILLVSGLAGAKTNVPAIPIGRIPAVTLQQVRNYLDKVKNYESTSNADISWRKNVLHLSGGKSAQEIVQLSDALKSLVPLVENGVVQGTVKAFQKQSTIEVEKVDITKELNSGVGMISYFGHGSPTITDLDMGYISDATRGYQNISKYPLMYFNGCGVGNIFKGNTNEDYTSSRREPLSTDWLCAKDKGAIAIIANSYYTFLGPSSKYIRELYLHIYEESDNSDYTIGQIQQNVARQTLGESSNASELSNLHQSVLQGDPAMYLIRADLPDFAIDPNVGISIRSESDNKTIGQSGKLTIDVPLSNLGRGVKEVALPLQIKYIYQDGLVEKKNEIANLVSYPVTLHFTLDNLRPLKNIEVNLDPLNSIKESNKVNNVAELDIDWNLVKDQKDYPGELVKDVIAPTLNVKFNNEVLKNGEVILPNPLIGIHLEDNNILSSDTTLIEISLKQCGDNSCEFKRVSYSSGQLQLNSGSGKILQLAFIPAGLVSGGYELLVHSKDQSGNISVSPYRILFEISDKSEEILLTVSPNPASDYVHFELLNKYSGYVPTNYYIYDSRGNLIEQMEFQESIRNWYWKPSLRSGLYMYKVLLQDSAGKQKSVDGKIVLFR